MFNFACSDCKPTDPATSTVKVDLKGLASGPEAERLEQEQVQTQLQAVAQQTKEKEASEALRQAERQAAARQAAKEAEEAIEAQRQAEEDDRLRKHREAEQEAQRVRQAEEAGRIAEAAAAEDEQEHRRLEQESLERETAVATFLKLHGFTGVNSCKKSLLSSTYPLHKAAEAGDDKMVSLLCRAGANPTQKNSWGSTPAQVAQKSNKKGSHFKVLTVLATPDDAAPYAGQQSAGGA